MVVSLQCLGRNQLQGAKSQVSKELKEQSDTITEGGSPRISGNSLITPSNVDIAIYDNVKIQKD